MPLAGPPGTLRERIQVHAPYWNLIDPLLTPAPLTPAGPEPRGKPMADPERASPFTIPAPQYKFVEGPPSEPRPSRSMTVGGLIHNLIAFADFYERASADIDREEGVTKPWYISQRDTQVDVRQRDFQATVAIGRVRSYVLSKYDAELTIATARRLLGDLIRTCSLSVEAAEALTLQAAMDTLETAQDDIDQGKADSTPPAADSPPASNPAQPADVEQAPAATPRPRAADTKGKRIDARMLAAIRDDAERVYWSAQQWADHLHCAKSTVLATDTWQKVCKPARERERLARGKQLRRRTR
jgi:hypothetical protein